MRDAICDTSPLQYLYQAALLDLLPRLYSRIVVPGGFALDDERLSEYARLAITSEIADRRSPAIVVISMVEIVYLAEKCRVPENTFSTLANLDRAGRLWILPVEVQSCSV